MFSPKTNRAVQHIAFIAVIVGICSIFLGTQVAGGQSDKSILPEWVSGIASTPLYNMIASDYGVMPTPATPYVKGSNSGVYAVDQNLWTVPLTSDETIKDAETTITALTIGSTDYVFGGFMSDMDPRPGQDQYSWRLRLAFGKTGTPHTISTMPMPPGYDHAVDPTLAANLYSSGVHPFRVYYAGLFLTNELASAIGVWHSDPPYTSWSGPVLVETGSTMNYLLDKPDLVVSGYSSSRGVLYITYGVRAGRVWKIRFARSADGGATFSTPLTLASGTSVNASQIVANPYYDRVYVVWVDYSNNEIVMRYSLDEGVSWTLPEVAAQSLFVDSFLSTQSQGGRFLSDDVPAQTVLQARFNSVANRIGVVYHQWEDATFSNTDVWFASKGAGGWSAPVRVNPITVNDQWIPGVNYISLSTTTTLPYLVDGCILV